MGSDLLTFDSSNDDSFDSSLTTESLPIRDSKASSGTSNESVDDVQAQEKAALKRRQIGLLQRGFTEKDAQQIGGTPFFTQKVLDSHPQSFTQYGFLAGDVEILQNFTHEHLLATSQDPRLYINVAAPSSVFICGSQGSGKSHTLSCLLESFLAKSEANTVNSPLAAMVFHYDTFSSDEGGAPCEAACMGSDPNIKVKVFCAPTNIATIKRTYKDLNVSVEPLRIDQAHLNTQRMLDLMAVSTDNGPMPLYLHTIMRILKEMHLEQQQSNLQQPFNYGRFKYLLSQAEMTPAQKVPLDQRLDALESCMDKEQVKATFGISKGKSIKCDSKINDWSLKYMTSASEAATLTDNLLSAIRLQRHLGLRVLISTQEPSISPKLLDLCSLTITHKFSSSKWLRCLRAHLAALDDATELGKAEMKKVLNEIVKLNVGQALLFGPSASIDGEDEHGNYQIKRLGMEFLRIQIRDRITENGGKSQMVN